MSDSAQDDQARHSLLLIDDVESVLRVLSRGLVLLGFNVHTASSRSAAVELAKQERYSLVLLDIQMPGLSLSETMLSIRAAQADTPILLMTGGADPAVVDHGLALGGIGPVWKPISIPDLNKRICGILDRKGIKDSGQS
ncbi:MAG: response regulator [Elusimicrobiota bacterium]|jgi:DNA-binding response OmpR family regulator